MKLTKLGKLREKLQLKTPRSPYNTRSASVSASRFIRIQKQRINNRASPMKLTRLYQHMSDAQKDVLHKADFSGLLEIKCSKIRPDLCRFLMESFDPKLCAMVFPGRGTIQITEEDVQKVLCIPRGGEEVRYELDQKAIAYMIAEFGLEGNKQPTISFLEETLIKMKTADDKYLMLWVVYAICSVLAPTTGTKLSPRCYPSLVLLDQKKARGLNFCKFVLQILCATANAKGKNIYTACMLFMMIKYVDSLEFPELEVCQEGSRVGAWSNEMVSKIIDADQTSNSSFGKLQLKEQYRQSQSILFNNLCSVERFIRINTPDDCTNEEHVRYTDALEGACTEFELLMQRFIRKASGKEDNASSSIGVKRKSPKKRKQRVQKKQKLLPSDANIVHGNLKEDAVLDESLDVIHVQKQKKSDDSNFMIPPKELRPRDVTSTMPTGCSGELPATETCKQNTTSGSQPKPAVQVTGALSDLCNAYASCSESLPGSEEVKVKEKEEACSSKKSTTSHRTSDQCLLTPKCEPDLLKSTPSRNIKSVSFADENETRGWNQKLLTVSSAEKHGTIRVRSILKTSPAAIKICRSPDKIVTPSIQHAVAQTSVFKLHSLRGSPESFGGIGRNALHSLDLNITPVLTTTDKKVPNSNNIEEQVDSVVKVLTFSSDAQSETKRWVQEACDPPPFDQELDVGQAPHEPIHKSIPGDLHLNLAFLPAVTTPDEVDTYYDNFTAEDYEELAVQAGEKLFPKHQTGTDVLQATAGTSAVLPVNLEDGKLQSNSVTALPQEWHKRLVKPGRLQKSPYIDYESTKNYAVSKNINDVYNAVCGHGIKSTSNIKLEDIIDFDNYYVMLADLADSVRPEKKLVNIVAEVAINILSKENENPRKLIMPLRISGYLIDCRFGLKEVERLFTCCPGNRLDHKDSILFPVLQLLTPDEEEKNGHYFLFTINIKAERFEILDSLRPEGDAMMMEACSFLASGIKYLWNTNYRTSNIKISHYPIVYIPCPKQTNLYDCGFFTLKFVDSSDARKGWNFGQKDIYNIRKIFTYKMLDWHENKIDWRTKLNIK